MMSSCEEMNVSFTAVCEIVALSRIGSSRVQVMFGRGNPIAEHMRLTLLPATTSTNSEDTDSVGGTINIC